ncbi:MAG: threonine--tRNA ligase [Gemmatimonadota bacterium]|uniref:threonine--tRNA ligase n=1 Tax=Candidatus Palauibacter scopulicola TaxID=3056741 RepID=UPI00239ED107|nr:threonine--tRNA ligase [Candidatus Palauibacter scopulicola]MDE2662534.1 threonine--tRNA ligase [Candidatus Palauibacter scopulicola]
MNESPIAITLPDGSPKRLPRGSSAADLAAAIGPGLARAAVAARVDGVLTDLSAALPDGAQVAIVTRSDEDPDALYVLRHSAAHALATAVRERYPGAGIGFGPPIDDGFYYDFEVPAPFTPEDLEEIERTMAEVAGADDPFERREVTRDEARALFADDPLKLERLDEIPEDEAISVYRNGPFLDLCRGPHAPRTGEIRHFRLLSAAGAYWRGDERRQMLQRIYGTAFYSREALEAYIARVEEARKRDHRKLGRELDLFSIQDEIGPGLVCWHPRGARVQLELRRWIEDLQEAHGYQFVYTPHISSEALFRRSGHLPNYAENMYPRMEDEDGEAFRVKPMNCPGHITIYAANPRSYRDLPVRLAEVANVYRNERSGTLHGLLRVRMLTMDDGHVFCTPEQIEDEIFICLELVDTVMTTLGLDYRFDLSTRPDGDKRIGGDEVWDVAEGALRDALERGGLEYKLDEGGGAFYGPKIDIKYKDAIGREWQGATIQLDFNLPERFELEYMGTDNKPHRPVMIHRAIFGTLERFTGVLIEHFAGAFPPWLAPVQVRVLPITDAHAAAAGDIRDRLAAEGLRVELDARSDTLGYRIRDGELQKVPYLLVVGDREIEAGTVAVRARGADRKQEVVPLADFVSRIRQRVETRSLKA